MPPIGLVYPNLKTARAKEHLDTLKKEMSAYLHSNPCTVVKEHDPRKKLYKIRMTITGAPLTMGLILGDFAYCLRSALDQLAWQLALLSTSSPFENTQFPILETRSANAIKRFERVTKDIPKEAVTIIESLQPYYSGDDFKESSLWRLNRICNVDKHRIIPTVATETHPEVRYGGTPLSTTHDVSETVIRVGTKGGLPPKVDFDPTPPVDVFFSDESGLQLRMVDVRLIYRAVTKDVIPRFAKFFPEDVQTT